jgi:hypothetical protein
VDSGCCARAGAASNQITAAMRGMRMSDVLSC